MPIFGAKSRAMRGCASKLACGHRIGPCGSYEFAKDFCKNSAFCRADVGIGPYMDAVLPQYFMKIRLFRYANPPLPVWEGAAFFMRLRGKGRSQSERGYTGRPGRRSGRLCRS